MKTALPVLSRILLGVLPLAWVGCSSSGTGYADASQTAPYTEPAPLDPNAMPSPTAPTAPNAPANNAPRRTVSNEPKPWESGGAKPTAKQEYPLGEKIAGKPGLVKSPYARYAGEVDVKGIASGTQVKCPYTGKIFIVP
ncbi:MAG: hypothetical protein SFU85_13050 [Candidatus Methylacidiphilales bacterium]|nr:hypothetical protein [Candidatus Methylacidiphilales bacterium]